MTTSHKINLSDDQVLATQRWQSDGVVYLISGLLPGRGSIPSQYFYWATAGGFALGGHDFEPYIRGPVSVQRGSAFQAGGRGSQPAIEVPVYNLPFAHSEALVAAVTDNDFAWEGAEASLRVAYLKPGQAPSDLSEVDWTYLVKDGFLGAPRSITSDGFNLVIYDRGARRNQKLYLPRMPTSGDAFAIDSQYVSRMAPIVVGAPHGWVKLPTLNVGVRGFTVSSYDAGETTIQFRAITVGKERLLNGNYGYPGVPTLNDEAGISIRYRTPVYQIVTGAALYDEEARTFTIELTSGLAAAIPRGSFVQQHGPGRDNTDNSDDDGIADAFSWMAAGHDAWAGDHQQLDGTPGQGAVGWLFADGTVKQVDLSVWDVDFRRSTFIKGVTKLGPPGEESGFYVLTMHRGAAANPVVPVYYTPGVSGEVTQQPEFTTSAKERLSSKLNYPTGGTGTDNGLARDGSEETACSLGVSDVITLTFNSPPSPFSDGDTSASTLWVVTQGNIDFTNSTGSTTFGQANGSGGVNRQFRFTQAAARDYNETVRCVGAGGSGGSVVEVWWEHDLEVDVTLTRSKDVLIGESGISGAVGEIMEYAELVMRYPVEGMGFLTAMVPSGASDTLVFSRWSRRLEDYLTHVSVPSFVLRTEACHPTAVMSSLARVLGKAEANMRHINVDAYDRAHQRFIDEDIRLNFVLLEEPTSWTDLEDIVASQSRSRIFYGPSGHEIHFLESTSGIEAIPPVQEFRLPGVPGADCLGEGGPLFERTPVSEVANVVQGRYDYEHTTGKAIHLIEAKNAESIAANGERKDTRGVLDMTMHSSVTVFSGAGYYDAAASVSGILQFYADRQSFSQTRFRFTTAWIAAQVDRESIVRVYYCTGPNSFRHSTCIVEEVGMAALDSGRFTITARAVLNPQKGIEYALTWEDIFVENNDAWVNRLTGPYDTWDDYWSPA